jgi:hypothetical protein
MLSLKRGGWPYATPPNVPFDLNPLSPQARGLVAWWPMLGSRSERRVLDLAHGAYPATLAAGNPTIKYHAQQGRALACDSTDDRLDVSKTGLGSGWTKLTCAVWAQFSGWEEGDIFLRAYDGSGWLFMTESTSPYSGCRFDVYTPTASYGRTGTGALTTGQTTCLVAVYDGAGAANADRLKIYINGQAQTLTFSGTIPAAIGTHAGTTYLCGHPSTNTRTLNGLFFEARVYNRALPAAEVQTLHQPATRWQLYRPMVRSWAASTVAAPPAAVPSELMLMGVG